MVAALKRRVAEREHFSATTMQAHARRWVARHRARKQREELDEALRRKQQEAQKPLIPERIPATGSLGKPGRRAASPSRLTDAFNLEALLSSATSPNTVTARPLVKTVLGPLIFDGERVQERIRRARGSRPRERSRDRLGASLLLMENNAGEMTIQERIPRRFENGTAHPSPTATRIASFAGIAQS